MSGRGRGGRGRGGGLKAPPGRGGGLKQPPKKAPKQSGRGGGIAAPPKPGGRPALPTKKSPRKKGLFGKKNDKKTENKPKGRGRGTGVKIPPGAKHGPPSASLRKTPPAEPDGPLKSDAKTPRAFVPSSKVVKRDSVSKSRMPKSKKLLVPSKQSFGSEGSNDLQSQMGTMASVGQKAAKVKRSHRPRYEKKKWFGIQNTFFEYEKIKDQVVCEGSFSRMKPKVWAVIYYDMILMYQPGADGLPDSEDKFNGMPIDYFFLDNIVDSAKVKGDPGSMQIICPTKVSKDNLKLKCDSKDQFQTWFETIKALAEVFETTDRDGMKSRSETDSRVKAAQQVIPLVFEPTGFQISKIPASKAAAWLTEMRGHFLEHRKHIGFLKKIERFSEFRVGPIAVYCNFYFARDRDGPVEILEGTKKKVFAEWEIEVQRIIDLCEEVLSEEAVDKDHVSFHQEDCQIAAFLIDIMNNYGPVVHGVKPKKLILTEKVAQLDDIYGRLSVAPLLVDEMVEKA